MKKNYIVLNGKYYDAVTGALIKQPEVALRPLKATARAAASKKPVTQKTAIQSPALPATPKKRPDRVQHAHITKPTRRKPKQSKTLMRHAVKKPAPLAKPSLKKVFPATRQGSEIIVPKKSAQGVDASKLHRAKSIPKSATITRFRATTPTKHKPAPVPTHIKPVALRPAPSDKKAKAIRVMAPKPDAIPAKKPTASAQKQQLLERALENARSHEAPKLSLKKPRHRARRRILSSLAALGAVLVIGSFVAYLNKPSVELQVASVRAGFQASLPHTPIGYEQQSATASKGKVSVSFIAPNNNDRFTLTQEASSWDSQTLFDSIVADNTTTYQAIQNNGRTIYVYDNDKAAWVDGGILYKVSGSTQLSSDQIVSLATSM